MSTKTRRDLSAYLRNVVDDSIYGKGNMRMVHCSTTEEFDIVVKALSDSEDVHSRWSSGGDVYWIWK
jgi:hypothetical protein